MAILKTHNNDAAFLFSLLGKKGMLLLFSLIAYHIFGQITILEGTKISGSENITLQSSKGTTIYIIEGTNVCNLIDQKDNPIKIVRLPKYVENENTYIAKKEDNKKANSTIISEKTKKSSVEEKERNEPTFSQNKKGNAFFGAFQSQIAAISSSSQSSKFLTLFSKEYQPAVIDSSKQKTTTFFLNKNFNNNIESTNSIRPPPFILV